MERVMQDVFGTATFPRSHPIFATPAADRIAWLPWRRRPDRDRVEQAMARAFDAIRHYAQIAWWDGSSVGLHLHGYVGMFGFAEADFCAGPQDRACEDRARENLA